MAKFGLQKNTLANRSIFALITASLIVLIGLSGCGKKGALYLPESTSQAPQKTIDKPAEASNESVNSSQTTQQDTP